MEPVFLVLVAGFPPAMGAKRSSLLFTWKNKTNTITPKNKQWCYMGPSPSSHGEFHLIQRCGADTFGWGLSGAGGLRFPSFPADLTRRWPGRLLHAEFSDADTFTAQAETKGRWEEKAGVKDCLESGSSSFPAERNSGSWRNPPQQLPLQDLLPRNTELVKVVTPAEKWVEIDMCKV